MCVLLVLLRCLPIVDGSTGVSAVLDVNHKNRKPQEPHTHAKADAIHCLVANKHFTIDISLQAGDRRTSPVFTEAWDLQQITESHILILQGNSSMMSTFTFGTLSKGCAEGNCYLHNQCHNLDVFIFIKENIKL